MTAQEQSDVLLALAERCEREEPSAALDAAIFCTTWPLPTRWGKLPEGTEWRPSEFHLGRSFLYIGNEECPLTSYYADSPGEFRFTTSLDAAVSLVPEGYTAHACWAPQKPHFRPELKLWKHHDMKGEGDIEAHGDTLPLALCAAALRARAAIAKAEGRADEHREQASHNKS